MSPAEPGVSDLFLAEPQIRVLFVETEDALNVAGVGLSVLSPGGPPPTATPEPPSVRVEVVGGALVSDETRCSAEGCVFEAPGGLSVNGSPPLPGRLEVTVAGERLLAVLELPVETYLRGVVSAELPASWSLETKMAQAIAARSYALAHLGAAQSPESPFDVQSNTLDQVYRPHENAGAALAVERTRGQVLAAEGSLVEAFYHSTCGGRTEDPHDIWPDARPFPWAITCTTCTQAPRYTWQVRISRRRVATVSPDLAHVDRVTVSRRSTSGRALEVAVIDGEATTTMPAPTFRRAIGTSRLGSTFFEARTTGGAITFEGRGFGHGVGMCQWGAEGLVAEGQDHRAVLAHYYRGTMIVRAYD